MAIPAPLAYPAPRVGRWARDPAVLFILVAFGVPWIGWTVARVARLARVHAISPPPR